MIVQKQLFRHDPDNGVLGDCYRTAVACLLDLPAAEVPHFFGQTDMDDAEVRALMQQWLAERGLTSVTIGFGGSDRDVILRFMSAHNPGLYYMLSGTSPRGTHHVVIFCEDEMVCDPHPDGGGIVGPAPGGTWWLEFFAPMLMRRRSAKAEPAEEGG